MSEYDSYDVCLVRHSKGHAAGEKIEKNLRKRECVAIHYKNEPSFNKQDYDGRDPGRIEDINDAAKGKVIVVGYYKHHKSNDMFIGEGDERKIIIKNESSEIVEEIDKENVDADEIEREYPGSEFYYLKGLKLENTHTVSKHNWGALWGRMPHLATSYATTDTVVGRGRINSARAIMADEPPEYSYASLSTEQRELMCEEFVRMKYDNYCSVMPEIGEKNANYDFAGFSGDTTIRAQETTGSDISGKLRKMSQYEDEHEKPLFFAPEDAGKETQIPEEVEFHSLERVFDEITNESCGKKPMIDFFLKRRPLD
jgi:hypothetical protein